MRNTSKALERYLEGLTITQGPMAGEPLRLMPWQRRLLRLFDVPGDFGLSIPRAAAKTTTLSAIACAAIDKDGPLMQSRGEVIVAASSFSQAKISFEHVRAFLMSKYGGKLDSRDWRVLDTSQLASIENRSTGSRVRCIGSDPARAHGLAPALVLADEGAMWDANKAGRMVAALRTAQGKMLNSRFVAIGTMPDSTDHWFSQMLRNETSIVYAAGADDDVMKVSTWHRANPSLRFMPTLMSSYKRAAKRAERDPQEMAAFKAYLLNQEVADTVEAVVIDPAIYAEMETNDYEHIGPYVLGLDVAKGSAQSAAACYYKASGFTDGFVVFPRNPSLAARGIHDGCGDLYLRLAESNDLLVAGDRVADVPFLLGEALRRWGVPTVIVSDTQRSKEVMEYLDAVKFPLAQYVLRRNGAVEGSEDLRAFRDEILDGRLHPRKSLLLRNGFAGARTHSDHNGNVKHGKGSEGGRRQRFRDDIVSAIILAVAQGSRMPAEKPRVWRYAGMA